MNLKKASIILIIGLVYICINKIIKGLFPILTQNDQINSILTILWIIATLTIILFIVYFQKEIKPLEIKTLIPLYLIILFTGIIIILRVPFKMQLAYGITKKILINSSSILNAASILLFLTSFYKRISNENLKRSVRMMIWGFIFGLVLGLIMFSGYLYFAISSNESKIFSRFQIIAILVFAFTYYTVISFLIKLIKIKDYKNIF
jgi:hypothetical protein